MTLACLPILIFAIGIGIGIGIGISILAIQKEKPTQALKKVDEETALKIFISTFTISAETSRDFAKLLSTLSIAGLAASIATLETRLESSENFLIYWAAIAFSVSFISTIFPLAGLADQHRSFSKKLALSLASEKEIEVNITDLDPSLKGWYRLTNICALLTVFSGILFLSLVYWLRINP